MHDVMAAVGPLLTDPAVLASLCALASSLITLVVGAQIRRRHDRELKLLERALAREDRQYERVSEAQFQLYSALWNRMLDLQRAAEDLWRLASDRNLVALSERLEATRIAVAEARLIIEREDHDRLIEALDRFGAFELGKRLLRDLRSDTARREALEEAGINLGYRQDLAREPRQHILAQIRANAEVRRDYDRLVDDLVGSFRWRIGANRQARPRL